MMIIDHRVGRAVLIAGDDSTHAGPIRVVRYRPDGEIFIGQPDDVDAPDAGEAVIAVTYAQARALVSALLKVMGHE